MSEGWVGLGWVGLGWVRLGYIRLGMYVSDIRGRLGGDGYYSYMIGLIYMRDSYIRGGYLDTVARILVPQEWLN